MTCRGCQRVNDARRRYCGGCGLNLSPACPRCQFVNEGEDRYCGGCGDALLAALASPPVTRPVATPPAAAPTSLRPVPKAVPPRPVLPPPAPRAAPAPVVVPPVPPPPAATTDRGDALSVDDLRELLRTSVADAARGAPGSVVSQDDIDSLFGGVGGVG